MCEQYHNKDVHLLLMECLAKIKKESVECIDLTPPKPPNLYQNQTFLSQKNIWNVCITKSVVYSLDENIQFADFLPWLGNNEQLMRTVSLF